MADALDALNQLLRNRYQLTPDEFAMFRRQPPLAGPVPPSTSSQPPELKLLPSPWSFSVDGSYAWDRNRMNRQPIGWGQGDLRGMLQYQVPF